MQQRGSLKAHLNVAHLENNVFLNEDTDVFLGQELSPAPTKDEIELFSRPLTDQLLRNVIAHHWILT